MKGSVILSETMLETTAILISFILIVLVVQLVFSQQNQRTFESVFESLSRDVATSIDRAAATAGNIEVQVDIPKGLRFTLNVDQKALIIKYGDKSSTRTFFSSQIKSGPYSYVNPKTLCIVKTVNDNSVYIVNKTCSCNPNDNVCDPECNLENKCDPKCMNDNTTGVCNPFCAKDYPNICDKNCYKNYPTGVCEANCVNGNQSDNICSPDCNGVKKGVCDFACYNQYSNGKTGVCDPDCPPKGNITVQNGIKVKLPDGHCYTGCVNTTVSVVKNPSPLKGPCVPVPDGGFWTQTKKPTDLQCVYTDLWSCGTLTSPCFSCYQPCIGDSGNSGINVNNFNACCTHTPNAKQNQMNSSDTVCCCEYKGGTCQMDTRGPCVESGKYAFPSDSPYCQSSGSSLPQSSKKIILISDGVCDLDCNATKNICDPDCPNSPACENICSKENQKATPDSPCCSGLVACPGDNICKKLTDPLACCGNGICEGRPGTPYGWLPGFKTRWETYYTCPQDCKIDPQTKFTSCQSGPFSKSVCYTNVYDSNGHFIGFKPVWRDGIFQVCGQDAITFLDRRNWNIKELIKTWTSDTPEGWAWDNARYQDACNKMNSASQTILTNENYNSSVYKCCGISGAACDADSVYLPQCSGVGFCIDHSSAVVTILRTLGVPAKNVYSVFALSDSSAHAWVLFYCDPSEPENRKPLECNGNWGNWLSIDATAHYVAPVNANQYSTICLMWNDQGLYAQTEGRIDATRGYAYNNTIPRSYTANPSLCLYDQLCKQNFGIDCVVP